MPLTGTFISGSTSAFESPSTRGTALSGTDPAISGSTIASTAQSSATNQAKPVQNVKAIYGVSIGLGGPIVFVMLIMCYKQYQKYQRGKHNREEGARVVNTRRSDDPFMVNKDDSEAYELQDRSVTPREIGTDTEIRSSNTTTNASEIESPNAPQLGQRIQALGSNSLDNLPPHVISNSELPSRGLLRPPQELAAAQNDGSSSPTDGASSVIPTSPRLSIQSTEEERSAPGANALSTYLARIIRGSTPIIEGIEPNPETTERIEPAPEGDVPSPRVVAWDHGSNLGGA